jgi:hypothetical protein
MNAGRPSIVTDHSLRESEHGDAKCTATPVRAKTILCEQTFQELSYGAENRMAKCASIDQG